MEMSKSPRDSTSKRDASPAVKFAPSSMLSPSPTSNGNSRLSSATKSLASTNNNHNNTTIDQTVNRSVFTPVLTPRGERGESMVLLSPSRSLTETLVGLATSTGHQLEDIWDEVGYSPEDRASQLSDLLIKFRDICEHKIAEERGVAETFRQTIVEAKEEMKATAAALKTDIDLQLLSDSGGVQTLTDELATVEAALEGLRSAATIAKEELKESQDYIIEAHDALGIEMDPSWQDIESDLTAIRREVFRKKKGEMKEELSTRMNAVIQLVRDCQQLMNDLRMEPEKEGSELDKRIAGSLVRSKDGGFIMASKFRSETCIGISSHALEELTRYVAELHGEKRRRKEELQEMGAQIAILWEKLRVPQDEQVAFTKSVQGLGTSTIEKGKSELKRLNTLKAKMLGKLIYEARETIEQLWEQINATEEMRKRFDSFYFDDDNLFNDELLDKHEEYIGHLKIKLEQMKPILRLIERREIIIRERYEYEELQKDPERLKQRGAAMTKQLMEEEKMAKRIKRELPRLTALVVEKMNEWKDVHGEDFLYSGEYYLDVIDREEEEWNQYKAEEMQRKLKKKQEETTSVENRYTGHVSGPLHVTKKKILAGRPLNENSRHNTQSSRARSRSRDVIKKVPSKPLGEKNKSNLA